MFDKLESPHYVTATSSAIFAFLHLTDFTLASPIELVRKLHRAPFNGELGQGLGDARHESPTAFAAFDERENYRLENIIANYARPRPVSDKAMLITDVKSQVSYGRQVAFSNINAILVFLARAKQVGVQNEECVPQVFVDALLKDMRATKQFFYLLLILGKHIAPDLTKLESLSPADKENILAAITTYFSYELLLGKIIASGIDLELIYRTPTPEHLKQVLDLLQIPQTLTVLKEESYTDYEFVDEIEMFCNPEPSMITKYRNVAHQVTLPFTDIFIVTDHKLSPVARLNETDPGFVCDSIIRNSCFFSVGSLLKELATPNQLSQPFLTKFHALVADYLTHFEDKKNLLLTLLDSPPTNVLDSEYGHFVTHPFPIVFGIDDMPTMRSDTSFYMKEAIEFRTSIAPRLGEHIRVIATDTPDNQEKLIAYLSKHQLSSVVVVLFEDLLKARDLGRSVSAAASAGFQRLSLLAHAGRVVNPVHGPEAEAGVQSTPF